MHDWIIIDGYNLLHRQAADGDLAARRHTLLRRMEQAVGALARRISIVFDGRAPGPAPVEAAAGVEVIFSPPGRTADEVIEKMVRAAAQPAQILVVASDRLEVEAAAASGAATMSCRVFLDHLAAQHESTRDRLVRLARRGRAPTLGDFFPPPQPPKPHQKL